MEIRNGPDGGHGTDCRAQGPQAGRPGGCGDGTGRRTRPGLHWRRHRRGQTRALVAAMSDESDEVRSTAATSLGRIGEPSPGSVLGALVTAMDRDSSARVRAAAAQSLGEFRASAIRPQSPCCTLSARTSRKFARPVTRPSGASRHAATPRTRGGRRRSSRRGSTLQEPRSSRSETTPQPCWERLGLTPRRAFPPSSGS